MGLSFSGNKLKDWCKGLGIKQLFTSVSKPWANDQTEVTNRTILQHLKSRLEPREHGWTSSLVYCGHIEQHQEPPWENPHLTIVMGRMPVAPAEIGELSWRVKYYNAKSNVRGLRVNLDFVEEARERAAVRVSMYKARRVKAYNARVKPRSFQVGELVMRKPKLPVLLES
ncbi:UNVERIFIED_CONTAM: hypothetical protein Sradi_5591300 [Sesamum radiatum]|uniref:Integrase catalytic domain-containing protein n=1 Tax=Sesamum radiatum TaxID=300843 RepID=A0AAW2L146_SESRA